MHLPLQISWLNLDHMLLAFVHRYRVHLSVLLSGPLILLVCALVAFISCEGKPLLVSAITTTTITTNTTSTPSTKYNFLHSVVHTALLSTNIVFRGLV